ncbi:GGDEF domain-containing protein [Marinicella sediminis]|uniref:diguanylate cyclase n=2 Tax=Marinicella sediminis TaxID=1792834 RepID=A0ABV7JDN5_9GAMM
MTNDAISTHRINVFKVLLLLNFFGAFWFAIVNFNRDLQLLAWLELIIVLITALALWRIRKPIPFNTYLSLATTYVVFFGCFLLFALNHPGVSQNIHIWITTIPLMTYLLLGSRRGLLLTSLFLGLVVTWHLMHFDFLTFWQSLAAVANVVCVVMAIWGMSHAYELANEKAQQQLQTMATRDHLTGLMNRSLLNQTFQQACEETAFDQQIVGLIVADIDHFKTINDQYGHEVGDQVLKAFADILRQCTNRPELAFRLGGEEFCLIIPNTTCLQAGQLAEQLRQNLRKHPLHQLGINEPVTVSCGIATSDTPDLPFKKLHADADRRMYLAKAQGRDQVMTQD